MFGNSNQANEALGKSLLTKMEEMVEAVKGHTHAMKQMGLDKLLPERRPRNVTFSPAGFTWDNHGYPYTYIVCSGAQTLVMTYTGQTFNIPLQAGYNAVAIPDGANVTSPANFTALVFDSTTLLSGDVLPIQGNVNSTIVGSGILMPTDMQHRKQTTIQTHNAVSVGASGTSVQTSWMDTDGYEEMSGGFLNDAAASSSLQVYWSNDGTNIHYVDAVISQGGYQQSPSFNTNTRARYAKLVLKNADTVAHTMSAWAYLKA